MNDKNKINIMKALTNLMGIKVNYIKPKKGHSIVLKLFIQSTKINDKKEKRKARLKEHRGQISL